MSSESPVVDQSGNESNNQSTSSSNNQSIETPALQYLRTHNIPHKVRQYPYVEHGGARASTAALGLKPGHVIKSQKSSVYVLQAHVNVFNQSVNQSINHQPFIVSIKQTDRHPEALSMVQELLQSSDQRSIGCISRAASPGNCTVDTRLLAKSIGVSGRSIKMAEVDRAEAWTGYQTGGTSPWGMKTEMDKYIDSQLIDLKGNPEIDAVDEGAPVVLINGGGRGTLVRLELSSIIQSLKPKIVSVCKLMV